MTRKTMTIRSFLKWKSGARSRGLSLAGGLERWVDVSRAAYGVGALLLASFFLAAPICSAETEIEPADAQMILTLKHGVKMVMENNLDVQIERSGSDIAMARIRSAAGTYNAELYAEAKRADARTPLSARASAAAGGLTSTKSETYSYATGYKGKTALGTTYSLDLKNDSSADTFNRFNEQYTSFTGVTVTQPLFKDFGRDANDQLINIARKDLEISLHSFKSSALDILLEYGLTYWELIRSREEVRVRASNLELSRSLLEFARKKLKAGAASRLDVTRAEAAVAARRAALLTAGKSLKDSERALKLLITKDAYAIRDTEIIPIEPVAVVPVEADLDESIRQATESRPDYLEAKAEIKKSGYKVSYAENQIYPRVDIETSYGYSGLGTTFGESVRGMDSNPQWTVGLMVRYPLGNDTAEGDLSAARIESTRLLFKLKKIEQGIVLDLDGAIKELKDARERAANAKTSVELSSATLKAEQEKYAAGLSTIYDVLRVQDELAQAQLVELAAIVDYNEAVIKYNKVKGTLLIDWGVAVSDSAEAR